MKEGRANAPQNVQGQIMAWLSSAFRLVAPNEDLWSIPLELVGFDASLATHLEAAMNLSTDPEFSRRLRSLDKASMSVGKTIPCRKLLAIIACRAIRDPQHEDGLHESALRNLVSDGGKISNAISFLDELLELLGVAR